MQRVRYIASLRIEIFAFVYATENHLFVGLVVGKRKRVTATVSVRATAKTMVLERMFLRVARLAVVVEKKKNECVICLGRQQVSSRPVKCTT